MEIIKIHKGNLIDSEELHQFLEIKTPYKDWVKRSLLNRFNVEKDFFAILRKSTGGRPKTNYYLTIRTAKKLAMMAKTAKGDEAREYFVKCEETLEALKDDKRFQAFMKLEGSKGKLKQNIANIGGTDEDYLQIDLAGRRVLFNGEPVEDEELQLLLLYSRGFATEVTNIKLKEDEHTIESAKELNKSSHKTIRHALLKEGITPEDLPTEEKIKKLGE